MIRKNDQKVLLSFQCNSILVKLHIEDKGVQLLSDGLQEQYEGIQSQCNSAGEASLAGSKTVAPRLVEGY